MGNYEQIKLTNGSTYDVVAGAFRYTDDKLTITMLPGFKNLEEVYSNFDNSANVSTIELLGAAGDIMDIRKGYIYLTECKLQKDYVIGRNEVDNGLDEEGNPIKDYKDITGTVVTVALKKQDIRKELDNVKETVDILVVANLEG